MIIQNTKKAFTLVEIMIVVAIVAILALIAVPQFMRARISTNHVQAKAALKAIGSALEQYNGDNGMYPSDTDELISALPSYIKANYFTGVHSGYVYAASLSNYSYTITATPDSSSSGVLTFSLTTGAFLTEN